MAVWPTWCNFDSTYSMLEFVEIGHGRGNWGSSQSVYSWNGKKKRREARRKELKIEANKWQRSRVGLKNVQSNLALSSMRKKTFARAHSWASSVGRHDWLSPESVGQSKRSRVERRSCRWRGRDTTCNKGGQTGWLLARCDRLGERRSQWYGPGGELIAPSPIVWLINGLNAAIKRPFGSPYDSKRQLS